MRKIEKPSISAKDALTGVLLGSRDADWVSRVTGRMEELLAIAREYEERFVAGGAWDDLEGFTLTGFNPQDLIALYEGTKSRAAGRAVRDVILVSYQNLACAYCSACPATTLDHVFPRHTFPALSAVPLNLVPCCPTCNLNKGTVGPHTSVRLFHPYFDDPTGLLEVSCDLHVLVGGPTFSYRAAERKSSATSFRIASSFHACQIAKTWSVMASLEFNDLQALLSGLTRAEAKDDLSFMCRRRLGKATVGVGWKYAFYSLLLENIDSVLEFIELVD